jgi:hypothetical protein
MNTNKRVNKVGRWRIVVEDDFAWDMHGGIYQNTCWLEARAMRSNAGIAPFGDGWVVIPAETDPFADICELRIAVRLAKLQKFPTREEAMREVERLYG